VSWSEWNDDEQDHLAPLPAHERVWRHPSEVGERAWAFSEPPLAIGRGLTAATGAIGGLLALAVLWTMVPTQAGRDVVATVRSTINNRSETGLAADRSSTTAPPTTMAATTLLPVSGSTTTRVVASIAPPATVTTPQRPMPTYQLQQRTEVAPSAVAVAVNGGGLVVTTAAAVSADLTVGLVLADGTVTEAQVLFVDERSGLAVLAPEAADGIEAFSVATEIVPGDQLTFFGDEQTTVTIADDNTIDATWATDASIREGTPVVNQRGELVALCSHDDSGEGRLISLAGLDNLQHAIDARTSPDAKVWLGLTLTQADTGELAIAEVDPAGPATAAGLAVGDVILALDDQPVSDSNSITALLAPYEPGDSVRVLVRRLDGSQITFTVTLADPKTTV
jgi:S1-C subfamily serine protease